MEIASFDIEEWKIIDEFPSYAVSNKGRIKRIVGCREQAIGKIISQRLHPNPKMTKVCYPSVRFMDNRKTYTRMIHQLVLIAFIGPRPEGQVANHKDGNKSNNFIENLEWTTQSKNVKHAFDNGLKVNKKGSDHCRAKLKNGEIWLIKKLLVNNITQTFIAKMFKVSISTIWLIFHNKHYKLETL